MVLVLTEEIFKKWNMCVERKYELKDFFQILIQTNKKEGKHFVDVESRNIIKYLDEEFERFMGEEVLSYILEISKSTILHYKQFSNCLSDVVYITYDEIDFIENNIIIRKIPFTFFLDTATLQELNFVTEHISNDEEFYKLVANYYLDYECEKQYTGINSMFDLKWTPTHGGGSSIKDVLKINCCLRNPPLSLYIVDKDCKSPNLTGRGSTANGVCREYKKCKRQYEQYIQNKSQDNSVFYLKSRVVVLEVRNIENLIPINYMIEKNLSGIGDYVNLLEYNTDISICFDIKNGVTCKDEENKVNSIKECEKIDLCSKSVQYYCKILKEKNMDFFKIEYGDRLINKFVEEIEGNVDKFNEYLQNCQYNIIEKEIKRIGKIVFSWAISKQNVSRL